MGETSHEEQARVSPLERKRYECPHDLRAGSVHVVGLVEAAAEREAANKEVGAGGGHWEISIRVECHGK